MVFQALPHFGSALVVLEKASQLQEVAVSCVFAEVFKETDGVKCEVFVYDAVFRDADAVEIVVFFSLVHGFSEVF